MKNFLFNFKTKPTLFTLFIIIGFLCAIPYAYIDNGMGAFFFAILITPSLIPVFIIYRYFIKRFKTKHIFITESILTVLFSIYMLVGYLADQRHLVIDLTNYSENYYLIINGHGEQIKTTDTRPSTFLVNDEAVLHENYFVLNGQDLHDAQIKYPKSWQGTVDEYFMQRGPDIQFGPFRVEIYYDHTFDFSHRTLDSLATLVLYARQHDISVYQAKKELVNVWAEMNYMYTTPLEPYVKNSKAFLYYVADPSIDPNDYEAREKSHKEWEIQNEIALPSDHGIYLSYTSDERIMEDLKRRAEHHNWSEKTMNELTEYYATRMPFGYFRLHIERPTEEQANSNSFSTNDSYRRDQSPVGFDVPNNPAQPPIGSGSTNWTNTMIFPIKSEPDSLFQVTILEEKRDLNGEVQLNASFTFELTAPTPKRENEEKVEVERPDSADL